MHRIVVVLLALFAVVAPNLPVAVAAQVEGNTYTSPQFGYQVTWEAPWDIAVVPNQENPVSVAGEFDYLALTAGTDSYLVYEGFYTPQTPAEMLKAYVDYWRADYPDIRVIQDYQPPPSRIPALVAYTDERGVAIEESLNILVLAPGESLLVVIFGTPLGAPSDVRRELGGGVSLVLPLTEAASAPARTPTPSAAEDRACEELASEWIGDLALTPVTVEVLGGCRQTASGAWFLPTGPDDPRLLGGSILTPEEASATAAVRRDIETQLAGLDAVLPQWMREWLAQVYDPVNHALTGHAQSGTWNYGTRQQYGQVLAAYVQSPDRVALAAYVGWWVQWRQSSLPPAICVNVPPPVCGAINMQVQLTDNYGNVLPPWPWDLADPLTLATFLDWALANGYIRAATAPAPAASAGDDCAERAAWMAATLVRYGVAQDILLREGPARIPDQQLAGILSEQGLTMQQLALDQEQSGPPPSAQELNALLVEAYQGFAESYFTLAEAARTGDTGTWNDGWEQRSAAYALRAEALQLMEQLEAACGRTLSLP